MHEHDGYAPHSHEVRADHLGVASAAGKTAMSAPVCTHSPWWDALRRAMTDAASTAEVIQEEPDAADLPDLARTLAAEASSLAEMVTVLLVALDAGMKPEDVRRVSEPGRTERQ